MRDEFLEENLLSDEGPLDPLEDGEAEDEDEEEEEPEEPGLDEEE